MAVNPGVIVDTVGLSLFPTSVNCWQGPIPFNSQLWLGSINGIGVTVSPRVYKSTDKGASWSDIDAADAPATLIPYSWAYPWSRGSKLYYSQAHTAPSGGKININLDIYEFDMGTGLWNTTPITTMSEAGLLTVSGNRSCLVCLRGTQPNFVLFYGPDSPNQLSAQIYSGGSWSGPYRGTTLTPLPPNSNSLAIKAATVDDNGIVHIFIVKGTTFELFYSQFNTNTQTFTDKAVIYTGSLFIGGVSAVLTSVAIFKRDTDEIIFPVRRRQTIGGTFLGFKILRGTPTSSPVWTTETIDLTAFFPPATYDIRAPLSFLTSINEDYSTIYLIFSTVNDDTDLEQKLWYVKNDGSGWSDPILIWDISTNAPQNFPPDWGTPQADGAFGGTIETSGNIDVIMSGLFTIPPSSTTTCGVTTFVSVDFGIVKFWRVREM